MNETPIAMRVQMLFKLQGNVHKDTNAQVFVAQCPALNISSQGESAESAREALTDAVVQTFRFQFDRGELYNFLRKRGFVAETGAFQEMPPQQGTYDFEVPLPLTAPVEKKIAL
jgi:predicted RNase H-like HicB family nuclease